MVATDQNPQQQQTLKGLLDMLQDEEARKALGRMGVAAASLQQPFSVAQPAQLMAGGGLLQQPTHPVMTSAGAGMMGVDTQQGGGVDMEKIQKFMKILGMG
jgi:hypothetical protein